MITKRQKEVLDYIKEYSGEKGYAPSLKEIKNKFRLKSESTVHQHIDALTDKGYIYKSKNQPRGIVVSQQVDGSLISSKLGSLMDSSVQESVSPKKRNKPLRNKIVHGDILSVLREFPDDSIDLVLADPPYNLSKGNKIQFQNKGLEGFGGDWNKVMENWDDLPFADYMSFTLEWLREVKRTLKPTGSVWVFGTYHNIGLINTVFQLLELEIINEVVWYKRNAFPNLAGRRLTASHETLLWAHAGNGKRNYHFDYQASKDYYDKADQLKERGKQMRTVWDIPNNKEKYELEYGKHPTQKPLRVCRRIIEISSKPNDLVLAPFSGAGSECVAAKEMGRNYVGVELEKEYVDISNERLINTKINKSLFD